MLVAFGKDTVARNTQLENALLWMVVACGKDAVVRAVPEKASYPMLVASGKEAVVRAVW
jgi:hypothetical protein